MHSGAKTKTAPAAPANNTIIKLSPKTPAIKPTKPIRYLLERLIAELCNTIYFNVILNINTKRPFITNFVQDPYREIVPALLQTCRQLRSETTDLLAAENTFRLLCDHRQDQAQRLWLRTVGVEGAKKFHNIYVTLSIRDEPRPVVLL